MTPEQRRALVRKLIAAELLARRGEGPLALRRPQRPPPPPPPPAREPR